MLLLLLILFVIIIWFIIDYCIHVFGTQKSNKPYDYVDFNVFYNEFNVRTKSMYCKYDKYNKAFEFDAGNYFSEWEVKLYKHEIKFNISGIKMMILINPVDYLKYRWFFFMLKYNYNGRNYKKGLFENKEGK